MTVLAWACVLLFCAAMFWLARKSDDRATVTLKKALIDTNSSSGARVDFAALNNLPHPVQRYFRKVLKDGQMPINSAELTQRGTLRTDPASGKWLNFSARELVVPQKRGFVWDARIELPLGLHLRVVDACVDGMGSGRLSFLSAFRFGSEAGGAELNAAALHRYLGEAVWFPTALLPEAGVRWTAIDEHSAIATLAHQHSSVALVFNFNHEDEVCSIASSGRWMRVKNGYRQERWEGHFSDYCHRNGMRIPRYGEVGWYRKGVLEMVWKGRIDTFSFT